MIDQLDLIDIYRTFHPKIMNFTFFSSAHGTFSRIDYILGHQSSLGKFKKTEIIPSIFSDHNAVRLALNYRRKTIKNSNIWRLNNTLLNNQQITEEIRKKTKMHQFSSLHSLSRVRLFATPWTAAYQAPPSMGFSRQEYWSGVPSPSPHWNTTNL